MKSTSLVAAVLLLIARPAAGQIMEMNGSWELSPEKSIGPSPVQETLVFGITEGVQTYTMTSVDADGGRGLNEWSIPYDGKDHPTAAGDGSTASIRRLGEKTEFVVNKRNGEITSTYTRVLADDDGTIISIGRDAGGEILWVRVFEKL